MKFRLEWDDEKAKINLKKHGISFHTAAKVFLDDDRIEIYDKAHSQDEDRFITIGMAEDVLFVVYTERCESIRMISARMATARERRVYYDSLL